MEKHIEIIFENVPDEKLDVLVNDLLKGQTIVNVWCSESGDMTAAGINNNRSYFPLLAKSKDPAAIFIDVAKVQIGEMTLLESSIKLCRHDGINEITVAFASSSFDASDQQAIVKLAEGTKGIAQSVGIAEYSCGYEASDNEASQLFFHEKTGDFSQV